MSQRVIAIALFCFSTSALALSPTAQDNRIAIVITPNERNQLLYEMRESLHTLFNMHNALAKQDMKAVAVATRPMAGLLERLPENVKSQFPAEFTQMAIGMQEALQVIARDAETKGDMSLTHSQMAEVMTYCSGCHDTYRVEVKPPKTRR
ncbi:MAG: cytochrome c [Pseudomonadota bacterium]|nr:cytochrome c [Pseudomonadota bacterium]MDP1904850.1 cytochrome c [Pseudomonadota bacterium]MDP2354333.1 cytochrome c [Pseudomonadota bacterium]